MCTSVSATFDRQLNLDGCHRFDEWRVPLPSVEATDYLASFCKLRWGVVREDLKDLFWGLVNSTCPAHSYICAQYYRSLILFLTTNRTVSSSF
jgi:hypothetical protein